MGCQYGKAVPTRFRIPLAPATERQAIERLVRQCLGARGADCEAWEAEIDARVARLYGLG